MTRTSKRECTYILTYILLLSFLIGSCRQELQIPCWCTSTSEPYEAFRVFAQANHGHKVSHWHYTMQTQLKGEPCSSHHHEGSLGCSVDRDCHLLVMGTPCNPFSQMRSKRYHPESVMQHTLTERTFGDAYEMLEMVRPVSAVLEQSEGFAKPISTKTKETPLSRPGVVFYWGIGSLGHCHWF